MLAKRRRWFYKCIYMLHTENYETIDTNVYENTQSIARWHKKLHRSNRISIII